MIAESRSGQNNRQICRIAPAGLVLVNVHDTLAGFFLNILATSVAGITRMCQGTAKCHLLCKRFIRKSGIYWAFLNTQPSPAAPLWGSYFPNSYWIEFHRHAIPTCKISALAVLFLQLVQSTNKGKTSKISPKCQCLS